MKKLSYLLCLLGIMLIASCSNEIPVPEIEDTKIEDYYISMDEARADLMSILDAVDGAKARSSRRTISDSYIYTTGKVNARSLNSQLTVYVFNFEDEQGFAIMSSDKRMPSMFALAESGSLIEGDSIENPGLKFFMDCLDNIDPTDLMTTLEDDIDWDDTINHQTDWDGEYPVEIPGNWETIYHNPNSCYVKWGQGEPYNMYCPTKDGKHTVTGCAATAVAQLMSIYKYPTSYNGYTFDWDEMCSYPIALGISETGKDNIARLMQQLGTGKNLDISYGLDASGAARKNIQKTISNFGYSCGGIRDKYSDCPIIPELYNGYPIIMTGKYNDKKGHAWLMHGLLIRRQTVYLYDVDNNLVGSYNRGEFYPRCNWGWGGLADGYYADGVFDVASGPKYKENQLTTNQELHNYHIDLVAIYGIRK